MHRSNTPSEPTFGFLSTFDSPEYGYFGGYLIVSVWGRPLEFHCTAPMRPSRAQQILYGPTLEPFLLGEQIGGTLFHAAQITPRAILTNRAATLCLRTAIEVPLLFVGERIASTANQSGNLMQASNDPSSNTCELPQGASSHCNLTRETCFFAGYELRAAIGFDSDRAACGEQISALARNVDLMEPFDRIHQAICEAQRLGIGGQEAYGQSAA